MATLNPDRLWRLEVEDTLIHVNALVLLPMFPAVFPPVFEPHMKVVEEMAALHYHRTLPDKEPYVRPSQDDPRLH